MAFIVFEGLDGAGKSTLIKGLEKTLVTQGIKCLITREPGGTELGEEIRQMLLRLKGAAPLPRTELLLYEAGRAQHVDAVIRPALENNTWVLCDRYAASSIAFQSGGRGIDRAHVEQLNAYATGGLKPELTVLLDLPVEESEHRRSGREADRFESEARDFHERVRHTYLQLAKEKPAEWLVINASRAPEASLEQLLGELRRRTWLAK